MKAAILPILLIIGCASTPAPEQKGDKVVDLKTMARRTEPQSVSVDHILISFAGTGVATNRSREAARVLAYEVLDQLANGGDWDKLRQQYSDDRDKQGNASGPYSMINSMVRKRGNRGGMVPAFGDVGFQLLVGEIAIADYDPKTSKYGYHIIKRVK